MALTNDDLKAISQLLDEKMDERFDKIEGRLDKMEKHFKDIDKHLDKIDNRLDIIELKQDRMENKLVDFQLEMKIFSRNVEKNMHTLKDEMETVVEVLQQNELIPT